MSFGLKGYTFNKYNVLKSVFSRNLICLC